MVIIAAVDTTDRAGTVITEAENLSRAFDCPLHIIHVISPAEFVEIERTSIDKTGAAVPLEDVRVFAEETATDIADQATIPHTAVGVVGDASKEVVRYATDHDATYIVVSPRKQSPVGKALFGSVAQSILLNSPCPVVSVTSGT